MIRNSIFFFYLFGISAHFKITTVALKAIVGGDLARVNQFPYMVSVQNHSSTHVCGGGIIHRRFVLTAGHCVVKTDGEFNEMLDRVVAGTNDLNRPVVVAKIKKIFVPMEFKNIVGCCGDAAVLLLSNSLKLSGSKHIGKLRLPYNHTARYLDGKTAVIAGFGWQWVMVKNNQVYGGGDSQLRYAEAVILNESDDEYFKLIRPEKQLGAKVNQYNLDKPRGVCNGDSGSLLVHHGTVIGIVSMSPIDCSEVNLGSLYTRVSHFVKFIEHAMGDKMNDDTRTYEFDDEPNS